MSTTYYIVMELVDKKAAFIHDVKTRIEILEMRLDGFKSMLEKTESVKRWNDHDERCLTGWLLKLTDRTMSDLNTRNGHSIANAFPCDYPMKLKSTRGVSK